MQLQWKCGNFGEGIVQYCICICILTMHLQWKCGNFGEGIVQYCICIKTNAHCTVYLLECFYHIPYSNVQTSNCIFYYFVICDSTIVQYLYQNQCTLYCILVRVFLPYSVLRRSNFKVYYVICDAQREIPVPTNRGTIGAAGIFLRFYVFLH